MSKTNADYITVNGSTYEKVSNNTKTVALKLRADILDAIDLLVAEGKFVSRGDVIRHLVRQSLEKSSELLAKKASKKKPKQPVGPKKPSNPPRQPSRPPPRMPQRRGR